MGKLTLEGVIRSLMAAVHSEDPRVHCRRIAILLQNCDGFFDTPENSTLLDLYNIELTSVAHLRKIQIQNHVFYYDTIQGRVKYKNKEEE